MNLEDLVPASTVETVKRVGLHKIAGAMLGVSELTIGDAAASIGAKAYLRRKEARLMVNGIAAYAAVTGEKVAENPAMMALLRRAVAPAMLGGGIGAVTHFMNDDPNKGSIVGPMAAGGLLGAVGGSLNALNASTRNSTMASPLADALQNFDRPHG